MTGLVINPGELLGVSLERVLRIWLRQYEGLGERDLLLGKLVREGLGGSVRNRGLMWNGLGRIV